MLFNTCKYRRVGETLDNGCSDFSRPNLRLQIFWDLCLLIILFIISVYLVYFTSQTLSRIFFLALLFAFFFSRKDYAWFAFFFILAQGPGYFFADYSGLSLQRLPLYTFVAGMSLTPIDLFVFSALVNWRNRFLLYYYISYFLFSSLLLSMAPVLM